MFESSDLFSFDLDPLVNFQRLFEEAKKSGVIDPTVMTLATVNEQGGANARVVLLKNVDRGDFLFFTNYNSTKAAEIAANARVMLVFYWAPLAVQIRVEGLATKATRIESEDYFATRPRLSQLGAWASQQSQFIDSYEALEKQMVAVVERFKDQPVPCPEHWGGYRVTPETVEFWFGMEGRLHYRYFYESSGKQWIRTMKSP